MISFPNYSNPSIYNAYGQQYYQNYYPQNYSCQQPYYPQAAQPCRQCPQMYYPNYANYPKNCQNCAQYGLANNRLQFPQKLPYSFVTSGDRIEDKFVINQPQSSAPFQSQHRKTYVPYTRKYIQYQDYIQYIPVQRSQWNYEKVMKQIDFVPQQYYQSKIQYIPQQRTSHRVHYLPIQQQIVHMPVDDLQQPREQSSRIIQVRNSNMFSKTAGNAFVSSIQPYSRLDREYNRRVGGMTSPVVDRLPVVRPAESSVQMVPSSSLKPVNKSLEERVASGQITNNINQANRIQASQVVSSVLNNNKLTQQAHHNQGLDFRESQKVFSEQFNLDHHQYQKKESIFNRYQQDLSQ